jgi:hypothetical protein
VRHGLPRGGSAIVGSAEVRVGIGGALHEGCSGMWLKLGVDNQGTIARPSIRSEAKSRDEGTVSAKMRGEEQDEGDVGGETGGAARSPWGASARAPSRPRHGTRFVLARGSWVAGVVTGSLRLETNTNKFADCGEFTRRLPRGEPGEARAGKDEKPTELDHGMNITGREAVM